MRLIAYIATALFSSHAVWAMPPLDGFPGPQVSGFNASPRMPDFLSANSPGFRFIRGVLMQAEAAFQDAQGNIVDADSVTLRMSTSTPELEPCLQISDGNCSLFWINSDQLKALASFVKTNNHAAFTLPGDAGQFESTITEEISSTMEPVGDDYRRDDWIAAELHGAGFEDVLRYIDYDDPYRFTSAFFEEKQAEAYRLLENKENGFDENELPSGTVIDRTYINADFHADFVAYDSKGGLVCAGLPARYYWTLYEGQKSAYLDEIRYAAPDGINQNDEHFELYRQSQSLFCTTAVLRSLFKNDESSLDILLSSD